MNHRKYLIKPTRFGNIERRREIDTKALKEKRSVRRTTNFNLQRNIDVNLVEDVTENINENIPPQKIIDRKLALQKFKAKKEEQKKVLKDKKKPPFVVGIPHHGSTPLLKNINRPTYKNNVKESKSPAKEFTFQTQKVAASTKKLTSPQTPTVLKRSVQKKPMKNITNSEVKLRKRPQLSYSKDDEVLAAPLPNNETISDEQSLPEMELQSDMDPTPENSEPLQETGILNNRVTGVENMIEDEPNEEENSTNKDKTVENETQTAYNEGSPDEHTKEVQFQLSRLMSEAERLLSLADKWASVALCEALPQETADEVDSVVGQTRLLTSDKFKQFHGLVIQFQDQTGSHPVTLDDLNGFWDMIYLQVESMNKRYMKLETLKSNNWVKQETPTKKRRRPIKRMKVNETKCGEDKSKSTTYNDSVQHNSLFVSEDQTVTDQKHLLTSVRLNARRTRSNSPSPFIAMRISGICRSIGKTPNMKGKSPEADVTPRSTLIHSAGTGEKPKRSPRNSIKTQPVEQNIQATANFKSNEELSLPVVTPRRSARLLKLYPTPKSQSSKKCITCDSSSCSGTDLKKCALKSTSLSKKLTFSPVENLQKITNTSVSVMTKSPHEENYINKPSTSRARFSLRPSVLIVPESNDLNIVPKKSKKRKQTSILTAINETTVDRDTTGRRSTRQSRKVTFEADIEEKEEKSSFKLPATPYRKSHPFI